MKRKPVFVTAILLIAAAILFFWHYDGQPGPLPDYEEAAAEINEALSPFDLRAEAKQILDMIQLDRRHVFVPYITKGGHYAVSFWVWEKHKWRVGSVDTDGGPRIWKLSENDPSRHYLLWNMRQEGQISDFSLYFIRERNAGRSNGIDYYTPRIQMEHSVDLDDHPYGAIPYPEDWIKLIKDEQKHSRKKRQTLFSFEQQYDNASIHWMPTIREEPLDVSIFSTRSVIFLDNMNFDFVMFLNEEQLERP